MLTKRVIPCLDVRNGRLTKGIKFKGNEDIGDPVETARRYHEAGADELVRKLELYGVPKADSPLALSGRMPLPDWGSLLRR